MARIAGARSSGDFGGLNPFNDSSSNLPIAQASANLMPGAGRATNDPLPLGAAHRATTSGQVKLKSRPFTGVTRPNNRDTLRQASSGPFSGTSETIH